MRITRTEKGETEVSLSIITNQLFVAEDCVGIPETQMKTQTTFYHAGCPVCINAEQKIAAALDPTRFEIESVHLGQNKNRIAEAEAAGVKSVPALVFEGAASHINHGADLRVLK